VTAVIQAPPAAAEVGQAAWTWKGVRQVIARRTARWLDHSTCLRYLHRLGFVRKRPKKRLLKADPAKRAAFVARYAARLGEAEATGATIWFADEAHFRADADPRLTWVPKGQPALVDSTSPRWGEKASYYGAVCLETGAVEVMGLEGNSCAETSVAFLKQVRARARGPLIVIWDNGPAHGGEPLREYLTTPDLDLVLVRLPAYSPDYNPVEHLWGWARAEVTANTCFGTAAKVSAAVGAFFAGLADRAEEVTRRCRTALQAEVVRLLAEASQIVSEDSHVVPVRESV
jgi:transposase